MNSIDPSISFSKIRLDVDALYSDESLFDNFEYKSSFQDKLRQKDENDFLYNQPFSDNDMSQFNFINYVNLLPKKNDLKINFGKDPFLVNKSLMKLNNNQNIDDDQKNKILKYWWNLGHFYLFNYKGEMYSNNVKANKTLEVNWKNRIPYLYNINNNDYYNYNDTFIEKCRYILRKRIIPIKYNNHVPIIIKNNKLLKKMRRKNRIIILNDINVENKLITKLKLKKKKKNE